MSDQDIKPTDAFFAGEQGSESPARASISSHHSGFDLQNASNPEISPEAHEKGKSIEHNDFIKEFFVLLF